MSEFIAGMEGGYSQSEHHTRRILTGDIEIVRGRLVNVLERLGYRVLDEQPLQAKRGSGPYSCSANILKHGTRLTVGLRSNGPNSTLAIFDYSIFTSMLTKGDRQTLSREVDSMVALVTQLPKASVCAACGTENTSDSRFCRVCGSPTVTGEPAELEILRLTAGARAGYQTLVTAMLTALGFLLFTIPLILYGKPKGVKAGWMLLVVGIICVLSFMLSGLRSLHTTLNRKAPPPELPLTASMQALDAAYSTAALPPASVQGSITEGTTELLNSPPREREPAFIPRQSRDTGPLN